MIHTLILAGALMLASSVSAQSLYAASNFIPGESLKEVAMAEWEVEQTGAAEQTGARILIAAGEDELKAAPAKSSRYSSKRYNFPSGNIRVLTFTKAQGGVLHQITTETTLVVVKGSAEVGVAGVQTKLGVGDVVNYPSGVLRSQKGAAEDTTVLLYTVGSTEQVPKAKVVRAKETKEAGPTKKPDPGFFSGYVQRFVLDGNSVRHVRNEGPGRSPNAVPRQDVLIYVTSGRGKLTVGDETKEVSAGDAIREEGAKSTHWEVDKFVTFFATDAPSAAPKAPAKAD